MATLDQAELLQLPARRRPRFNPSVLWLGLCSLALSLLLVVPLLALVLRVLPSGALGEYLRKPVVTEALRLSLTTTALSLALAVLIGTPVAYLLARYQFPGKQIVDTLIDLPMVLPPAVAGLALLITFGRRGLFGAWLAERGITLAFTTTAVILAQCFVAAPFYVKAAKAGFEGVDRNLERAAATLGSSGWRTFWRVTVPLALPGLLGGAVMTWARALGEFGATILFAGNFQGRTQTLPLAIYQAFESDLDAALVIALILVIVSFAVLLTFKLLVRRGLGGVSPIGQ